MQPHCFKSSLRKQLVTIRLQYCSNSQQCGVCFLQQFSQKKLDQIGNKALEVFECSWALAYLFFIPRILNLMAGLRLERVPDPARGLRSEEKLVLKGPNILFYPGPNLGKTCELFGRLDRAQKNVGHTRFKLGLKNFKSPMGLSQLLTQSDTSQSLTYNNT